MSQLPSTSVSTEETLQQMPVMQHLIVLRQYLFKIVGVTIFLFFCLLPFRNQTYQWLSEPLRQQLPATSSMIATDVTATFMAPFKLNLFVAFMLAMPYIIYQIWSFIKPALYEKEQHLAIPLLFGSIILFYLGVAFAYFITLPAILHFFISVSPETVAPMTD
ncbi:MAG: twin-arginine translocase subunit TatC, partial [Acinetobacter sp.]